MPRKRKAFLGHLRQHHQITADKWKYELFTESPARRQRWKCHT